MKCQNMKIADILVFITNLMTIYSSNVRQDFASSQTATLMEGISKRNFDTGCPYLSKIIHDNNLTDYTIDCKSENSKSGVVNEENVLQQTCLFVKSILFFICDSKHSANLDLTIPNNMTSTSICPFNFSHVQHINFKLSNHDLVMRELTLEDHCTKVCVDLYSIKIQCIVLNRLNNYLRSQLLTEQNTSPVEVVKPKLEYNKLINKKNESSYTIKKQLTEQSLEKFKNTEIVIKNKNETSLKKLEGGIRNVTKFKQQQNFEKTTTISKEEQKTKSIGTNTENLMQQDDLKAPIEDINEDLPNGDGMDFEHNSISDTSDVSKIDKIPAPPPKGKEIYPSEGFFQAEDSHFFFYFIMVSSIIVVGYLAFHNKNKILAYALEGTSGRRNRRRPNPARYRKLETNLEEAISSNATNSAVSNVVY